MPGFDSPSSDAAAPAPVWLAMPQMFVVDGGYPDPAKPRALSTMAMVRCLAGNPTVIGAPGCAGQLLPLAPHQPLFGLVGTLYGGNGLTNFGLPDLRGRVALGGGADQPPTPLSLSMSYLIAVQGQQYDWPRAGAIGLYAARVADETLPGGWLPADGRALQIAQYPAFFGVIGTAYGGDGISTFALPDLRGRAPIGTGQAEQGPYVPLGLQFPAGGPWGVAGQGLYYYIKVEGSLPPDRYLPDDDAVLGEVAAFAGIVALDGWIDAAGQLLPIGEYEPLFRLIGTTYGGDGLTNFALPNLAGRMLAGLPN